MVEAEYRKQSSRNRGSIQKEAIAAKDIGFGITRPQESALRPAHVGGSISGVWGIHFK